MRIFTRLLFSLFVFCTYQLSAQQTSVTIGTGTLTAAGTNGTPIYRSSTTSSFHHSKSIQLLTQAQLSAAGLSAGYPIDSVGFNKTNDGRPSGANRWVLRVYVKNSSATTLVSGTSWDAMITGAVLAYSDTIDNAKMPAATGYWMWPTAGFTYSGGSLETYIEWFPAGTMTSPFTTNSFSWQYTASGNQAMGNSASAVIPGTQTTWTTQARFYNTRITYTPFPCSGQPALGNTLPASTSFCKGSTINLSVQNPIAGAGATYQWLRSVNGVTYDTIFGATSPAYTATPDTTTYYRLAAYCTNSMLGDTSVAAIANILLPSYTPVPYFQGFESWQSACGNTDVPDSFWRNNPITGNNSWRRQDQGVSTAAWGSATGIVTPATGIGAANFHSFNASSGLIGRLDLHSSMLYGDPVVVKFDYRNNTGVDSLFVFFSDDDGASFTGPLLGLGVSATWTKQSINLGVVARPKCIVRLQARSDFGDDDIGVDNFELVFECTGTPNAGNITSSVTTVCANTNVNLSLTGGTQAGGLTYQWLTSLDGITYSADPADTFSVYSKPAADTTYYLAIVKCGTDADTTAPFMIGMSPFYACYCPVAATSTTEDDIGQFQIGALTNPAVRPTPQQSNATAIRTYTDFTNLTPTDLQKAVNYPATLYHFHSTTNTTANNATVYIDFNQNGLYTDPGESFPMTKTGAFLNDFTANILIPMTATEGLTGMRVYLREGAITGPCANPTWGEIEDYIVNILPPPACANPPVAGVITGNTVVCSGLTTTLVDTGYSIGTTIQWQTSTDGSTWTNVSGANSPSFTTPAILDTVYYRVKVTCVDSSFTAPVMISLAPTILCYCSVAATSTTEDDIGQFQIGTLTNPAVRPTPQQSNPAANATYTNFTSLAPTDLMQGVNYPATLYHFHDGTDVSANNATIYLDLNKNGSYADPGEAFAMTKAAGNFLNDFTATINIPVSPTDTGLTGMRVYLREGTVTGPCINPTWGEIEDYLVRILPPPPCIDTPVAGIISGPDTAATNSIGQYILSGYEGSIQWQYAFAPTGPYTILGLTTDTINVSLTFQGNVYIRAILSNNGCINDTTALFTTFATLKGDNTCDPEPLTFGVNGPYNTQPATTQVGEPVPPGTGCGVQTGWCSGSNTISNTMWFTFTAPASGRVTIQSPGFDTQIALWDADNCDTITKGGARLIVANDDDPNFTANGGVQFSSFVTASCLTPGRTYYVQLDPYTSPGASTTIVLTALAPINTNFTLDTVYCAGAATINLNPVTSGGTFTGTGVSGTSFNPTTAGVGGPYTITYKIGVCDSTVKTTRVQAAPVATSQITNVTCNGANDGAIDVTITGGGTTFTSSWSNGATTEDLTGLAPGSFSDTISNEFGCRTILSALSVTQPDTIGIAGTVVNVLCNGDTIGSISLVVTGGTSPYSYAWTSGDTTQSITGLSAGSVTVTVTDANFCTKIESYTVSEPTLIVLSNDSLMNVSCNGGADGAAYFSATGGVSPYDFDWSTGDTTASVMGLVAGTYTVTLTDANACSVSASVSISQPAALAVTLDSSVFPLCNGDANGGIYISVSGGTPNYTFAWSDGTTNEDLTNTTGGSYDVTVTDANGCTASATFNLSQPSTLVLNVDSSKNITCNGANNGAIFTTVTGGVGNYTYSWSTGATTGDVSSLGAGSYGLTVTDGNGCTVALSAPVVITEPAALVATVDSFRNARCNGQANGGVFISVSGGTPNYTYAWSNGPTTQDLSAAASGTYTCTVTDANGCSTTVSQTISQPTSLVLTGVKTNEFSGGPLGTAKVTASGGTPAYTYLWSNGATTDSIGGLIAGTYNVTVTDANGCTASTSLIVSFVNGIGDVDFVNLYEVYPNPTSGKFVIEVELAEASDVRIDIISSNGQLVKSFTEKSLKARQIEMNEEIAGGIYYVRMSFGETIVTKRLTVVR